MAIKLYYAPGACSLASHIAIEETGVAYETVKISTSDGDQRKAEYLKINPRGRVPTAIIDGHIITENVGIMTTSPAAIRKPTSGPRTRCTRPSRSRRWRGFRTRCTPRSRTCSVQRAMPTDTPAQESIKAKGRTMYWDHLKEIDGLLAGRKWSVGSSYSVVDGYLLVFYRWGNRNQMEVKSLPNYSSLMQRVLARPAVKKVMADEGITLD